MPGWPCTHTPVLDTSPVPVGGIEPDGFGGEQVPPDRDPTDVAARRGGEGEQPAHLAGGPGERVAGLDVRGAAATGYRPSPGAGHRIVVAGGHRVRPVRWVSRSAGSIPTPSAAANPAAWEPRSRRSRSLACPARWSTSAIAAGNWSGSVRVVVR